MIKKYFSVLLIFCLSFSVFAQENIINVVFNEKHHDFGTIREEDGAVVTEFTFVNTSQQVIMIKNVRASCGCTTPTYSRQPIAPNDEGKIAVAFNAKGQRGHFNKTVTIQLGTDNDTRTETLSIGGTVLPIAKSAAESFPHKIGNLLFRENALYFGSIVKGAVVEKGLEVFNNSDSEQTLTFANIPAHISISIENAGQIAQKQSTLVKITFNSEKMKSWGDVSETIEVKINGKIVGEYALNAVVLEDFSKITQEQLLQSPIAVVSTKNLNLTTIKIGTKRTSKIELTNNGKSPLIIRDIKTDADYLNVKAAKNEVAAGKSVTLNVSVDATKLDVFKFRKQVQLITNDPKNSVITLTIEWQTEK